MEYVLETTNLTKRYKDFTALNGLNMRIPRGAIYGFVGRNGAGKTTLIRLICGLQAPTSGGYSLYGIKNTSRAIVRSRRRMGAVVETPSIYMDMTAAENIRQQYRVLGMPSDDGLGALLNLVGLGRSTSPSACASGWASPSRWRAVQIFWCWTSRSTALTRRALSRCAS